MELIRIVLIFLPIISLAAGLRGGRGSKDGGRIVGGELIRVEEAPYMASVQYYELHICGGSIISKDYILTAAHCLQGKIESGFKVRVGSNTHAEGGDLHEVELIKYHPFFTFVTYDFDVGLIKLLTPIAIDDVTKQEISLPFAGEFLPEKTAVLASGWGETRNETESSLELRAVILATSSQLKCHFKFIEDGGVTNRMVCAIALNKDSCTGDSGGPLRRLSDGKLVGIVSFGYGSECAYLDYPGVYTRVSRVRPWILQNSGV